MIPSLLQQIGKRHVPTAGLFNVATGSRRRALPAPREFASNENDCDRSHQNDEADGVCIVKVRCERSGKARVAHGCCVEPFVAAGKVLELLSAAPRNTVRVTERNEDRPKLLAKVLAIPAGFEPATRGVEIRHSADHRLTTETPRTNGDKVRESSTNSIVFGEFFDCYLRSGRRRLGREQKFHAGTH
jgi:hypothetical protein